jgi:hypothetical protein
MICIACTGVDLLWFFALFVQPHHVLVLAFLGSGILTLIHFVLERLKGTADEKVEVQLDDR